MADSDSDSSLSDTTDLATNVLLGYASKDPTIDDFSQLGGQPTWLDKSYTPDGRLAKCKVCNSVLCLLLQLNGDLPERFPGHERKVYVFGCRRKACRRKEGSVRAIRAERRYEMATDGERETRNGERAEEKKVNLGETLFGAKAPTAAQSNPFASGPSTGPANPFAAKTAAPASNPSPGQEPASSATATDNLAESFAQKARISSDSRPAAPTPPPSTPERWPEDPKPYTRYHLDADTEYLDPTFGADDVPSNARVETNGEGSSSSAAEDKALFESTMDKTFQRFADRLSQNPEQVLRYEFGGQPLLYARTDTVGKMLAPAAEGGRIQTSGATFASSLKVPRCGNCGAGRVFELQLTPHMIADLEADDPAIDGMEWGTIIVGACGEDCQEKEKTVGEVGYLEEWVGVQWEEVADHRARR
ncbi:uncharacterized protein LTR77_003295 [Saxophila tyrrhenica]|uniref:Programmed cell death protein 2 C-terminal domain-containing protein n=1 Tax=Saxophila tyrrhenica TaxID=1690608 RepID=A0AAV9PIR8_9PEZI|nr:hypothetical protein LTR77_003295 [Saxophila tyrrhenica]